MKQASDYHAPVLLQDCVEGLGIVPGGVYVDVTFGGGGHSRAILDALDADAALVSFDRDADARANAGRMALPDGDRDPRFTLVPSDFRWVRNHLRFLDMLPVQGLLADLGVSSHQFDTASRGFSFRGDGPLDMRMDRRAANDAATLVNTLDEQALGDLLARYGEVSGAYRAARTIVAARAAGPIDTTHRLVEVLRPVTPRADANGFLAQVFQALRIAVNDELAALESLLTASADIIGPGGRLVVISYHSLEDRLVKNWMRTGDLDGRENKDLYGRDLRPFKPLHSKAIVPTMEEITRNPRARSARLRIAQRR